MRRVLLLTTPFDARARLDGTRRAILDLVPALLGHGISPWVLARPGVLVPGAGVVPVEGGLSGIFAAVVQWRRRGDVLHAFATPRRRTVLALQALGRSGPVVHTLTSGPVDKRFLPRVAETIATSAVAGRSLDLPVVPMPFEPEPPPAPAKTKHLLLFAGDGRVGSGLRETAEAFRAMATPWGLRPVLGVATRDKSDAEVAFARAVCAATEGAELLGELPSLLPHLAAARAVLLPASHTLGKLDHPRVLLEALSLGTRIVVGSAPTLAELLVDPSLGVVARDVVELREALEDALTAPSPSVLAVARVLSPRTPRRVADAYARVYARL